MSTEKNSNNQNMGDAQATEADRLRQAYGGVKDLSSFYQAQIAALNDKLEEVEGQKKESEDTVKQLQRRNEYLENCVKKDVMGELRSTMTDIKQKNSEALEAKDATIKTLERRQKMDKWTIGKQEEVIDQKNWKIEALKTNLSRVKEQLKKEKSRGVQLDEKIKNLEKGQGLDARASELEIENQRLKKLNRKLLEELEEMRGKRKVAGGDGEGGESEAKRMKVDVQKKTGTKKRAEVPKKTVEPGKKNVVCPNDVVILLERCDRVPVKTLTLEQVKQEPLTDSEEEIEVRDDANGNVVKSERIDEVPERYTMEMLKRDIFSDYEGKEELEDEI